MKNNKHFQSRRNISKNKSEEIPEIDTGVFDLLNKFGTYEIQPTCDTKNLFPQISQGIPNTKKHK